MSIKITDGLTLPEVLDPNTVYVVYVDDDKSMLMATPALTRTRLAKAGVVETLAERKMNIEVVSFESPVDALETLKNKSLHRVVVLSDNDMPEMQGTELISQLHDVDSDLPVAILSALPDLAKSKLPENVKHAPVFTKPNDGSVITNYIIPNVLAAAEKPALPAVQQQAGAAYDLARK